MDEIRIIDTKLWSILLSLCKDLSFDRGERVTSNPNSPWMNRNEAKELRNVCTQENFSLIARLSFLKAW